MADGRDATQFVRDALERACRDFTQRIAPLGFQRTKKMFWTRRHPLTVDFLHFHRHGSTYGAVPSFSVSLRVHCGIRVLNDVFPAAALNGPDSDQATYRLARYHLRFNAKSGDSYDRCLQDLVRFATEQGEPWFQTFQSLDSLMSLANSPLSPGEKERLAQAASGQTDADREAASLKLLGIKTR